MTYAGKDSCLFVLVKTSVVSCEGII